MAAAYQGHTIGRVNREWESMNSVTEAYLAACARPDSPLQTAGLRLPLTPYFAAVYGKRQLARPLFVPEGPVRQAADDLLILHKLLQSLPNRLFDGDVGALCSALGMSPRVAALAVAGARHGSTPPYGRPDLYYDGTSFTLLEMNSGSELAGVDWGEINEAYLRIPEFAAFAEAHRLGYVDVGDRVAMYLRELAAPITGGADPVVAMIDISDNMTKYEAHYHSFVSHMAPRGIRVLVTHIADVGTKNGKLTVDGTPVDVAMRYFTLEEISASPHAEEWLAPVMRANEAGTTILFASLDHGIYANKGTLAMVWQLREEGALSADEAAVVDRIMPWTRRATPDLRPYAEEHRDELVLKPCNGLGGVGVVIGWTSTPEQWTAALDAAQTRPYILQARADVVAERVPQGEGLSDWLPVFGLFVFEQGYAGCYVRALPVEGGAVINEGTGAAFTSLFTIPDS